MPESKVRIPHRLLAHVNPAVLHEVEGRIAAREEEEASNSLYYERYLALHADHILSEAARRGQSNFNPGTQAA